MPEPSPTLSPPAPTASSPSSSTPPSPPTSAPSIPAENVTIVNQDVLSFDFAAAAARAGQPLLVFGNLPYYITSPILLKLAAGHTSIERAALMVQREVADRVTAQPGSRDYGSLSVTVQMYGPVQTLFTLPPVRLSLRLPTCTPASSAGASLPALLNFAVHEPAFLSFARTVFAQKRKTLSNNLRAAGFAPDVIASALTSTSIDPRARAEELSLESLAALWRVLQRADPRK